MFEKLSFDSCPGINHEDYKKLDEDGLVMPGDWVFSDDILVGKMSPMDLTPGMVSRFTKRGCSTVMKSNKHRIVDNVLVSTTKERYRCWR